MSKSINSLNVLKSLGFEDEEIPNPNFNSPEDLFDPDTESDFTEIIEDPIQESQFNQSEVYDLAKSSLDFLCALAMPTIFQYCFPPVFLAVWSLLISFVNKPRDFSQLAIGLPRGFGKTTLIKIYILYCILFTNKKFILVISSTAALAENIVSDVVDMLNEENIKKVFGDWRLGLEKDTLALKKFGFRGRNIILAGIGAGTSLRGMNLKHNRPDEMIFEDFQTREDADSPITSQKLEQWMIGTAMKAKSPHGCQYIFVANMYPTKYSILRKLKSNPNWIKFIAGGILTNGESLWEELQPISQLMNEFASDLASGHPEIFFSEVLNDENAAINPQIDLDKIPLYPYRDDDIPSGNFIIIDPSGNKLTSDATAIGYVETYDETPVLKEVIDEVLSPGETIRKALQLCMEKNCRLVAVESVAYQATLKWWFDWTCQQYQITGIECVEVYPGSSSKNSRILGMFQPLLKGEIHVHPKILAQVTLQISQFNPLRKDNKDDVLDLLTYMQRVVSMYQEYIVSLNIFNSQDFQSIGVQEFNTPF